MFKISHPQRGRYTAQTGRVWTPPWMQAESVVGYRHVVRC